MQLVMTNFGSVNPECFGTGKGEAPQEVKINMIDLMKRIVKAFDLKDAVDVAFSECFENKWVGKENFLYVRKSVFGEGQEQLFGLGRRFG